jgi:hypothetical protein
MTLKTSKYIEMFHLHEEVDKFVVDSVKEFFGQEFEFSFYGIEQRCMSCRAHVPHVTGSKEKDGITFQVFCLGKEGHGLVIITEKKFVFQDKPMIVSGYYYMKKDKP